jgi:hypothetical protein
MDWQARAISTPMESNLTVHINSSQSYPIEVFALGAMNCSENRQNNDERRYVEQDRDTAYFILTDGYGLNRVLLIEPIVQSSHS